jgi:hypothetical protein
MVHEIVVRGDTADGCWFARLSRKVEIYLEINAFQIANQKVPSGEPVG